MAEPRFFLQWKNTHACFDFYCPCNPEEPQHFDGYFGGTFTCGSADWDEDVDGPEPSWCGRTWQLPHTFGVGIKEAVPNG